jgi:hypothetical protein
MDNRRYNAYHDARTAFFALFESVDDVAVASALFDAAAQWARDRGLDRLVGPRGFARGDGLGMLVEGYEHPAVMNIPYHHAYYQRLVSAVGLEKEIDYLSGTLWRDHGLAPRFFELAERVKARRGLEVLQFKTKDELRAWMPGIHKVYNEAFTHIWNYYPVDEAEIRHMAGQLLSVADPSLIKLVLHQGEVAGFLLAAVAPGLVAPEPRISAHPPGKHQRPGVVAALSGAGRERDPLQRAGPHVDLVSL